MSNKNNGGDAFPSPGVVLGDVQSGQFQQGAYEGMTLRDYFAAQLAPVIFSTTTTIVVHPENGRQCFTQLPSETAEQAYALADAMISERAK